MQAIDELVERWRNNPDCEATLALCAHLSNSPQTELLKEVGASAETWHSDNAPVMLSVGRMYLDSGLLSEAQAALVHAGRLEAKDPVAYRFLGEVLLRRGDATRSEKVLERAMRLGANDAETRLWRDRAGVYKGLQARQGSKVVAREVERTAPLEHAEPPASGEPPPSSDAPWIPPGPRPATRRSRPPQALARPGHKRRSAPPGPRRRAPEAASSPPVEPAPQPELELEAEPASGPKTIADDPMPTLYGMGAPPTAQSLRAAAHALGTLPKSPSTEVVLQGLAEVGLFEPSNSVTPTWESAARQPSRRPWRLGAAGAVLIAAGFVGYQVDQSQRLARVEQAQVISSQLMDDLSSADLDALAKTESQFKKLFELDSRSPQAALLWLENRIVHTLLNKEPITGIEAALKRAQTVGVPPKDLAHGLLISALSTGDLDKGEELLSQWGDANKENGLYQLVAGALLEQRGNPNAATHYEQALRLLPDNKVAHLLAARFGLLQFPRSTPAQFLGPALSRLQSSSAAVVLRSLSRHGAAATADGNKFVLTSEQRASLPTVLRGEAYALEALEALEAENRPEASLLFKRALRNASSPFLAQWVANQALEADLGEIARQATLRAAEGVTSLSGMADLAVRIALAAGDLANAQKAAEGADKNSASYRQLQAVVAYENLNAGQLKADGNESSKQIPALKALWSASSLISGSSKSSKASPSSLAHSNLTWGSVMAVDLAMDTGDLDFADQRLEGMSHTSLEVALRRSRLHRYHREPKKALRELTSRLPEAMTTPRQLVEVILTLVDNRLFRKASRVLGKNRAAAGEMRPWLEGLILASKGSRRSAKSAVKRLSLPEQRSPLLFQTLALSTLTASGDRRAKALHTRLSVRRRKHPEVRAAARALGVAE